MEGMQKVAKTPLEIEKERQAALFSESIRTSAAPLQHQKEDGTVKTLTPGVVRDVKSSQSLINRCRAKFFTLSVREEEETKDVVYKRKKQEQVPIQTPVQEKTYKQRRKESKRTDSVRKITGVKSLDHSSLDLAEALAERKKEKDRAGEQFSAIPLYDIGDFDREVAKAFSRGYKADANGVPLNDVETAKAIADVRDAQDYASCDVEKRKPFLRRASDEIMAMDINMSMFTDEYVSEHLLEMREMADRLTAYRSILEDEENTAFFDEMEPIERDMIEARVKTIGLIMSSYLDYTIRMKGVDPASGDLIRDAQDEISTAAQQRQVAYNMLGDALKDRDEKEKEMIVRYQGDIFQKVVSSAGNDTPDLTGEQGGKEAVKKALDALRGTQGKTLVQKSDEELENSTETKELAASYALQALNIRNSSQDMAKANKELLGSLFTSLTKDNEETIKRMQDSGIPFVAMASKIRKQKLNEEDKGFAETCIGCGAEQVAQVFFDMYRKRMENPEVVRYLARSRMLYGHAKAFKGDTREFVHFSMVTLLNTQCASALNFTDPVQKLYFRESLRNALFISSIMTRMEPEEREKRFKESPVLEQMGNDYMAMVDQLVEKLDSGECDVEQEKDGRKYYSERGAMLSELISEQREKLGSDEVLQSAVMNDFTQTMKTRLGKKLGTDRESIMKYLNSGQCGEVENMMEVLHSMLPEDYLSRLSTECKNDVFKAVSKIGMDLRPGGELEPLGDYLEKAAEGFEGTELQDSGEASGALVRLFMDRMIIPYLWAGDNDAPLLAAGLEKEVEALSQQRELRTESPLMGSLDSKTRELERIRIAQEEKQRKEQEERERPQRELDALDAQFADKVGAIAEDAHDFKVDFVKDANMVFADKQELIIYMRSITATPELLRTNPLLQASIIDSFNAHAKQRLKSKGMLAFRDNTPDMASLNALMKGLKDPDYMYDLIKSTGLADAQRTYNQLNQAPIPDAPALLDANRELTAAVQKALSRITDDLEDGGKLETMRKVLEKLGPALEGTGLTSANGYTQSAALISNMVLRGLTMEPPKDLPVEEGPDYTMTYMKAHGAIMNEVNFRATATMQGRGADTLMTAMNTSFKNK